MRKKSKIYFRRGPSSVDVHPLRKAHAENIFWIFSLTFDYYEHKVIFHQHSIHFMYGKENDQTHGSDVYFCNKKARNI